MPADTLLSSLAAPVRPLPSAAAGPPARPEGRPMIEAHGSDPVGLALRALAAGQPLEVLDVGGGSGTRAVPLAVDGCRVTVVDPSMDALATLRRRAAEAGVADRVRGVQADTDALGGAVPDAAADLVLCHHVLESVDDPVLATAAMAGALKPGGTLSLLVAGRQAAVLALSIAGRFSEAAAAASSVDGRFGVADPLCRRYDIDSVTALLTSADLVIDSVRGVNVVSGLVPGAVLQDLQHSLDQLAALDEQLCSTPPFRDIAADLHVVATRDPVRPDTDQQARTVAPGVRPAGSNRRAGDQSDTGDPARSG